MVTLTRITGATFALNPDLIERVDRTPDTVITLVDGTKYLVHESLEDVVAVVIEYRAHLINVAGNFADGGYAAARASRLTAVPNTEDVPGDAEQIVAITPRNTANPGKP